MTLPNESDFNDGVYGEFIYLSSDLTEISFWLYKHTACKFQLVKAKNKKVIAKKRLTN